MKEAKVVISDTTPLIALEKIPNGFKFIRKIYSQILIPIQVLQEISAKEASPQHYLKKYGIENLIVERNPVSLPSITGLNDLDDGEKYAIALAYEKKLPILIHERKGRNIAIQANLEIRGIAGEILYACKTKLITGSEAKVLLLELYKTKQISESIYKKITQAIFNLEN